MTPGDAAVSVCMSAGKVIAQQADRIAELEAKVLELEAELQRRAKQIGVACMKHDLTHSLACGHCYAESRRQVERLKELWFSDADPLETEFRDEALAAVEKERT